MKKISFYLTLPLIYLISWLPFPLLYLLSDFLFLITYYIVGYRKFVVRKNLQNSFPEKSAKELKKIEIGFYRYIVDFFLEMLKCITISKDELEKRISIENRDVLEDLYEKKRNIVVCMGHYGNHEWVNQSLSFKIPHLPKAVYRPLSNPDFDKLFYDFRTKFGGKMVSMQEAYREMKKTEPRPFAFYLVNDQSAPPEKSQWIKFLNQETSFFLGTEKIPRDYDMAVVYLCIQRVKRGFYKMKYELLVENPNELPLGEINIRHAAKLERDIMVAPETWFWSHKRWKFKMVDGEYQDVNYRK